MTEQGNLGAQDAQVKNAPATNAEVKTVCQIVALSHLLSQDKKVAFVKGNRTINPKNLQSKVKSVVKYGNIIPILYVTGKKAVSDGCQLVDTSGIDIPDSEAVEYIVIIDGQHRYSAAIKSGMSDDLMMYENYTDASTQELLAEANVEAEKWNGEAILNGVVLFNPKSELGLFCKKLSDKGYSLSTISKITSWGSKLNTAEYGKLMKGAKCSVETDLERANSFLDASARFGDKLISKRYIIDAVIELSSEEGYKNAIKSLSYLTDNEVKLISSYKGEEIQLNLKSLLRKKMAA